MSKRKSGASWGVTFSNLTNGSRWITDEVKEIWKLWNITTFWNIDWDYFLDNLKFPTWATEITNASWSKTWWDWYTESKSFTLEKSWFYIVKASWNQLATSVRLAFPNWFEYLLWQAEWTLGSWSSSCYHSSMVYLYAWTYTWKFYSSRYQSSYGNVNCKLFK